MYVAIMTILNSSCEIIMLSFHGVVSASQLVLGFNYGAKYHRVLDGIKLVMILSFMKGLFLRFSVTVCPDFYLTAMKRCMIRLS